MTAVNHFDTEELTEQTESGTPFVTKLSISGGSLAATTKYLIICRGILGGASQNDTYRIRVETEDDTVIEAKSEMLIEPATTTADRGVPYFFVHSYTTDSSPAAVNFQMASPDSSEGRSDQITLVLIDLDDLGSANFFETVHADNTDDYPTTEAQEWSIAGSSLGTDEWHVFGYQRTDIANVTNNYRVAFRAAVDASSNSEVLKDENEGEDAAEFRFSGFAGRHKASSGTPNFECMTWVEAAAVASNGGGYGIALRTSAFADYQNDFESGTLAVTTTEATYATITSYSPSADADHLIFSQFQLSGPQRTSLHHEDDTVEMRTGDQIKVYDQNYDSTTLQTVILGHLDNILASDTSTYTMRIVGFGGSQDASNRQLSILSLEKAAAVAEVYPPFPRRQLTTVRM